MGFGSANPEVRLGLRFYETEKDHGSKLGRPTD
jgi:hypothetical protein